MANQQVLLLLLLLCCTSLASNLKTSQQTQYQIEVKQSTTGKTCPSRSAGVVNLNLICSPDDGSKWSWNSTALLDQGETLRIYESTESGHLHQPKPIKKEKTTPLPPTHHATTCNLVWVDASKDNVSSIPNMIKGGYEENGEEQFICRTRDPADVNSFTGKMTIRQGLCLISWRPDRAYNAYYQVLTNPKKVSLRWVKDKGGHVPPKAWKAAVVKVNTDPSDYYVGRTKVGKSLQVGKIKVKGAHVLFYVNNGRYKNYTQAFRRQRSPWYYKNLDNKAQKYSVSYEALVVC